MNRSSKKNIERNTEKSTEKNIVWAIDPSLKESKQIQAAKEAVLAWEKSHPLKIQPVSIVTPAELNWPVEYIAPWGIKLAELAENSLIPVLRSLRIKNLEEPRILLHDSLTKRGSVEEFLKFTKELNPEVIIVMTHERKGIGGFRIGSFTQALIEKSPFPVLTVRPDSIVSRKFSKIMFCTDFSKSSQKVFNKLLNLAQDFKSRIVLFNAVYEASFPVVDPMTTDVAQFISMKAFTEDLMKNRKHKAQKWIVDAHDAGVEIDYVSQKGKFALSRTILTVAQKEKVDLIVMGIESHPIARAFLGSSVREVIGASSKPVLVVNSQITQDGK